MVEGGLTGPLSNMTPVALQGAPTGGAMSQASVGSQFGRGVAAGAGAAGAMPPIASPAPQAPSAPLGAPMSPAFATPTAAAPAGGAGTFAAAGSGGGSWHPGGQWRRSGGRDVSHVVVRVGAASGWNAACSLLVVAVRRRSVEQPATPSVTGGAGTPASTGFMPVRDQVAPPHISRDVSMTGPGSGAGRGG